MRDFLSGYHRLTSAHTSATPIKLCSFVLQARWFGCERTWIKRDLNSDQINHRLMRLPAVIERVAWTLDGHFNLLPHSSTVANGAFVAVYSFSHIQHIYSYTGLGSLRKIMSTMPRNRTGTIVMQTDRIEKRGECEQSNRQKLQRSFPHSLSLSLSLAGDYFISRSHFGKIKCPVISWWQPRQ